ncbi:hypothetical protein [Pelagibius sp. Alg239-R121]|uniref:hypothetical protein n=1 Tax=Pelagibius sp. Alg239-R121 TaxID=2993448 RepID=UPI0024A703AA|nr:hypothetical protein [Pelagibius sp. Alg239-R121]
MPDAADLLKPSARGMNVTRLPAIPVHDLDAQWPEKLFQREIERAKSLLAAGSGHFPDFVVKQADRLSRSWLRRSGNPYLDEIDAMNAKLDAPGIYFLNVNYEWGCTSGVTETPEGGNLLRRVLDWPLDRLGADVVAARCNSSAGRWVNVTWPGFTGSIQGMAPGRFAAAIHQAPMPRRTPIMPLDWLINRRRVWNNKAIPPAHLLRQVFESCTNYAEAKHRLMETELALPSIFLLSGIEDHEGCVIERSETKAFVRESPASAGNHWQSRQARASARGDNSDSRSAAMLARQKSNDMREGVESAFDWLKPPILNDTTRLVMVANASKGDLLVQGFEKSRHSTGTGSGMGGAEGVTEILHLECDRS